MSNSITDGKSNFYDFPFYEKFEYKLLKATNEILNHILFKFNLKDNYHEIKIKENDALKSTINNFVNTLNKIKKSNTKISIFILPTIENLNSKKYPKHFLENIKIENININNMYYEMKNLYFNNAHLNKKGHDYFSKVIYDKIK